MSLSSLSDIALKYCSDKGTIPWRPNQLVHGYTAYYEQIFEPIRNEKLNVLDIGGWGENNGGSSLMWREYFPNANIYSLDCNPGVLTLAEGNNIKPILCDLDNETELFQKLIGNGVSAYDVVIEDGSHKPKQQARTLLNLSMFLNRKGFHYMMEDLGIGDVMETLEGLSAGRLPYLSEVECYCLKANTNKMTLVQANHLKLLHVQ